MAGIARAVATLLALLGACGCTGSGETAPAPTEPPSAGDSLAAAPVSLHKSCIATAEAVGYAVPCPTRIPPGLTATRSIDPARCRLEIIGPGCGRAWRGWIVGSSETPEQHLVITGTPRLSRSSAKVVNGPGWYPQARVRLLERISINGWRMRAVYVPWATNDGSAFTDHVVLIWTVDGHTYGVGFHKTGGIRRTLELDEELARGIELVGAP